MWPWKRPSGAALGPLVPLQTPSREGQRGPIQRHPHICPLIPSLVPLPIRSRVSGPEGQGGFLEAGCWAPKSVPAPQARLL